MEEHRLKVITNMVLWNIFGHKRRELTGYCRKLHVEELNDLYRLPNIWVIISRRMRCVGHVALTEERGGAYQVSVRKAEERGHLKALGIEGRIILMWILKHSYGRS